jgi:outer membrane protein assembly factor BamA
MFDHRESIDIIAFNSSKGERWYRLVLSVPDFELRQGTGYAWAADVIMDYDKYLKNSFFGTGGSSQYEDRQTYTREPFEIQGLLSHSLSRRTVGQVGLRFRAVRNFNLPDSGRMQLLDALSRGRASTFSLTASLRYDSRNSYINPSHGWVVQGDVEHAPIAFGTNVRLTRFGGWLQYYVPLFYPKTIFATRLGLQSVAGTDVPIQFLVPLGGGSTLRGSPQDRYLLEGIVLFNAEVRFPLVWRFGGIVGWDAGLVDPGRLTMSLANLGFGRPDSPTAPRWASNSVVGLRFFMDTFLVRADIGFGEETTGFYLNFGHLF